MCSPLATKLLLRRFPKRVVFAAQRFSAPHGAAGRLSGAAVCLLTDNTTLPAREGALALRNANKALQFSSPLVADFW